MCIDSERKSVVPNCGIQADVATGGTNQDPVVTGHNLPGCAGNIKSDGAAWRDEVGIAVIDNRA